ncbi:MAG: type IV pilus assembly protein PilM [Nitrospirota bacterium]|nr:type IV pilus assembly protein PilM [Nitrospirota bacterium]
MMHLFGTDITAIDVGAGSVKFVRISGGKRPELLAAGLLELPLEPEKREDTAAALRLFLAGKKTGKRVVTMLPGARLAIRQLTLPKMPLPELNEAVRWESKRQLSYPLDEAVIEFLIQGEKREGAVDKYDVLFVAAERSAVYDHLAPFERAGIKVEAVDAHPLALRNGFRLRDEPEDANVLLADLGAGNTEINVFRAGRLLFSRCIETGGIDATRAMADGLGVNADEAEAIKLQTNVAVAPDNDQAAAIMRKGLDSMLREIRRSAEYFRTAFRERAVEKFLLTGGGALTPGVAEYFSRSLAGVVELDAPFARLSVPAKVAAEFGPAAPRFAAAVGAALRKAQG